LTGQIASRVSGIPINRQHQRWRVNLLATTNKSAEKRQRQNEKRRLRNKMEKSAIRSTAKKIVVAAQGKDKAAAEASLKDMIKRIDTAAHKGIVKRNAAARKKSRMQKLVNSLNA
jgi:small subunit ribosomal protein S20